MNTVVELGHMAKMELSAAETELAAYRETHGELKVVSAKMQKSLHLAHPFAELEVAILKIEIKILGLESRIMRIKTIGR